MENINDILARAAALRDETALNSIDPARAGGIMYDTLIALNDLWLQQGAALVISKIYASVAAMEADTAPVSDLTGQPIHAGQIVVIASSDADNGSVYRFNGVTGGVSSWSLVGNIGSQYVSLTPNTNTGGTDLHVGSSVLKAINAGYQFKGVATTTTNPGTPDQKVYYIAAAPGTYENFNDLIVNNGELAVLKWDGSWLKQSIELSQAITISIKPEDVSIDPEDPTSFEVQFGKTPESILQHGLVCYDGEEYPVYYVASGRVGGASDYGQITFIGGDKGDSVYSISLTVVDGTVYPASRKIFSLTPDSAPVEGSPNPISSGGVHAALAGKQSVLTFDDAPTENSANPVKSGGIYDTLVEKCKVLSQAVATLQSQIEALGLGLSAPGNINVGTIDAMDYSTCNGYPMVLRAKGVPSATTRPINLPDKLLWDGIPASYGQIYINTTSGTVYIAVNVNSISDWKALN